VRVVGSPTVLSPALRAYAAYDWYVATCFELEVHSSKKMPVGRYATFQLAYVLTSCSTALTARVADDVLTYPTKTTFEPEERTVSRHVRDSLSGWVPGAPGPLSGP
jgi:hypothetical protein